MLFTRQLPFFIAALYLLTLTAATPARADATYAAKLPGESISAWKRPPPLVVAPNASTQDSGPGLDANGQSEGARYIASLAASERTALLRDKVVLLQKEDPNSPSKDGTADAAIRGFVRALAIFEVPKAKALALMLEPSKLANFLEDLDGATKLTRVEHVGELTKFHIDFLWINVDFWIQHWFYPEHSRYEWFLDTKNFKNDIDGNQGYWQLFALNDRQTVGEYGVTVDTGIPLPRSWLERIQRRKIPDAMQQFQQYINSGGTYRKD